jgi:hypothetical protein
MSGTTTPTGGILLTSRIGKGFASGSITPAELEGDDVSTNSRKPKK